MSPAEAPITVQNRTILLVGQPNAGKTSLYNLLTGSRFKTVNYPGATVEYSVGTARKDLGLDVSIIDTPGIISLVPRSQDERVALSTLTETARIVEGSQGADLVVVAVDASQPQRHLVLVRQLQRAGARLVVALTMPDLAEKLGKPIDPGALSNYLNCPVVAVQGRTGLGLDALAQTIREDLLLGIAPATIELPEHVSQEQIGADFAWAEKIATAATRLQAGSARSPWSAGIDRVILHPMAGLLIFAALMTALFWSVFAAAAPFMDAVDGFFKAASTWCGAHLPDVWWAHLLADGVVAGGGSVLVFVPQIAILFLAMGLLEDSGYLARGAVLVDRPLSWLGLNGKSFVPMLSGYACAIPAAMAARTIPGRRERLLTLLMIPVMSCSARLPVWGLLLSFLVPANKSWIGGLAMTAIYLGSLVLASLVAVIGGKILRIEPSTSGFQIELPAWRLPVPRVILSSTWQRTKAYVTRAGGTILAISILFWFLMNMPSADHSFAETLGRLLSPLLAPMGLDWRVGMALIAAFAAREVFVASLAVVYAVQGGDEAVGGIVEAMRHATFDGTTTPVFTVATCVGIILFFIVSLQCLTTVAVMRREAGSWKFAAGQLAGLTTAGYVLAVIAVQTLRFFGIQ